LEAYTYENNNENSSFLVAVTVYNLTCFCHYWDCISPTSGCIYFWRL